MEINILNTTLNKNLQNMKFKVTEEILTYLGFELKGEKWMHYKDGRHTGLMIYQSNVPEELKDLVNIMTGTAFSKGKQKRNELG